MRIERELMRGVGPTAVLKLLERRDMYGYEIVEALSRESGGVLALGQGTLYPMLYNLEGKKLVEGYWSEGEGGRERKYYRLTRSGRARLARDTEDLRRAAGALRALGLLGKDGVPA